MGEGISIYTPDPEATERAQRMQENYARLHSNGHRTLIPIDPDNAKRDFMVMLGKGKVLNPDTGQPYTAEELAELFDYNPKGVQRTLRRNGVYKQPLPKVRSGPLPENEAAFFTGLAFADLEKDKIVWNRQPFVTVATEARVQYKHELMRVVFARWGEIRSSGESHPKTAAYLDSPTFDFMVEPKSPGSTILLSKSKYPPFLLGLMVGKMSGKEHRISLKNGDLLKSVTENFHRYFRFSLGHFHTEIRPAGKLGVIDVRNPGKVIATLAEVKSVATLPYFRTVLNL